MTTAIAFISGVLVGMLIIIAIACVAIVNAYFNDLSDGELR